MRTRVGTWLCTLALAVSAAASVMAETPEQAKLDQPVKDFKLRDLMKGEEQHSALADYKGKKAVVLSFVSYNCSVSWRYEKRLGKLLADYGEKDVVFLAVRSNARDTIEGMRKYAETRNLDMPVLHDEGAKLADYFNVRVTPTFVVIDKEGKLRYWGSYDEDADETAAKNHYVPDALDAVLGGKDVKVKQTRAFG